MSILLVKLHYRGDISETMPVRTRPIQPSVVKAAYKLWYRMTSYKVVLSKSPCASPVVTARRLLCRSGGYVVITKASASSS